MELKRSPMELKRSSNRAQMEHKRSPMEFKWSPMEFKWSPMELKWSSNGAQRSWLKWSSNGAQMHVEWSPGLVLNDPGGLMDRIGVRERERDVLLSMICIIYII